MEHVLSQSVSLSWPPFHSIISLANPEDENQKEARARLQGGNAQQYARLSVKARIERCCSSDPTTIYQRSAQWRTLSCYLVRHTRGGDLHSSRHTKKKEKKREISPRNHTRKKQNKKRPASLKKRSQRQQQGIVRPAGVLTDLLRILPRQRQLRAPLKRELSRRPSPPPQVLG